MMSRFWEEKTLSELSPDEWEALCDGCGRCCLHKLEDDETGEVYSTAIACRLLNTHSCQCSNYPQRKQLVPECTKLTLADIEHFHWLPETCAYRLMAEGKALYDWHPLISGSQEAVHTEGVSVRGFALAAASVPEEEWEYHLIPMVSHG